MPARNWIGNVPRDWGSWGFVANRWFHDLAEFTTNLELDTTGLDDRLTTAEADIDAAEADIATNTSDIGTNESDIAALDTRVGTAETNITSNDTDIAALDTRLTTAETDIDDAEADIVTNTANITSNDTDIAALDTRLTTAESDIDDLETFESNIGTYSSYTPTLSNCAGTVHHARYTQIGKLVIGYVYLEVTSVTGLLAVGIPVAANSSANFSPIGNVIVVGAGKSGAGIALKDGGSLMRVREASATGSGYWTVGRPFTWASGDDIYINFIYEAS